MSLAKFDFAIKKAGLKRGDIERVKCQRDGIIEAIFFPRTAAWREWLDEREWLNLENYESGFVDIFVDGNDLILYL